MSDPIPGLDAGRESLRRFLVGDDDLTTMLTKLTLIAVESVPGCDLASITTMRDGRPVTPVFTDKTAIDLDETQYELGDGPCLSAMRYRGVETVDTHADRRWPKFTAVARRMDVLGVLSAPLVHDDTSLGGLNLYSKTVSVFDQEATETASLFADQLGVAAAKAAAFAESFELVDELRRALESRAVIDQAKGIIMAQSKVSAEEAFDVLRQASQNQNRKLRAIAADIVDRSSWETDG